MDWSKAKTYLIVAFTITNILLSWSILTEKRVLYEKRFFTKESLNNLESVLQKKDIRLAVNLPKKAPKMGLWKVQYEEVKEENYPYLFEDFRSYIDILSGKQIQLSMNRSLQPFDLEHAKKDAAEFVRNYRLGEDFVLRNIHEEPDQIRLIYDSEYDGLFLEGSYMTIVYERSGRFYIERTKLEILEKSTKKKSIKTSVEAILQASAKIKPGETIEAIDLGYYYEEYGQNSLTTTKTATALPNWRIRTNSGAFYYIPAID